MPPNHKPKDCQHEFKLRRTVGFTSTERKIATAKGLSLPDFAAFDFCAGCWQINPSTETDIQKPGGQIEREQRV